MKPELFHRWYDPGSMTVRDFMNSQGIEHLVEYIDIDDEEEMPVARLFQLTGKDDIPTLVVNGRGISGTDTIIEWLRGNLLQEGSQDLSAQ